MPTISYMHQNEADAVTKEVYEDIKKTYGFEEPRGIYMLMGHTPQHLAASWSRSRFLYGEDSEFTRTEKHALTLAISATNNCEYCVRSHTTILRQKGLVNEDLARIRLI